MCVLLVILNFVWMASFKFFGYQVQKAHMKYKKTTKEKKIEKLVQMWVSASLHDIRRPHNVQLHSHRGRGRGSRTEKQMHKQYLGQIDPQ